MGSDLREVFVATIASLVDRVRLEIGDPGKSFVWQQAATGTNRYEMPYSPVDAATLQVYVDGVDVSDAVEVEEHTGVLTLDVTPAVDDLIVAQGTYFRYFTNAELEELTTAAVNEHLYLRSDAFGRAMNVSNLPVVEEYPAALLATIKALYTLATDSSFDIDISTPDGVSIPRSQRYRQLMEMIQSRREQYDQLCQALNIGLTRIDVFTFRRISRTTNRYVPVYMPQEVDDRTPPQRIYLPIPTYGGSPVPSKAAQYDMVFTQGDDFEVIVDFPFDVTSAIPKAQVRLYPESAAVVAQFTIEAVDGPEGTLKLSLTAEQTTKIPVRSYWDLQLTVNNKVETFLYGAVFCKRQITKPPNSDPNWSPTGWEQP
jgi:hypothetical protein